jgi:hypothetical protein
MRQSTGGKEKATLLLPSVSCPLPNRNGTPLDRKPLSKIRKTVEPKHYSKDAPISSINAVSSLNTV